MTMGAQVSGDRQPSEMQLVGRLALSAAALLLLTLLYRYYKSRVPAGAIGSRGCGKAGTGRDAAQEAPPGGTAVERGAAPGQPGSQLVRRKAAGPAGRAEGRPAGGLATAETPGPCGTPVGRERREEAAQAKAGEAMSHPRTGRLPEDHGSAPEGTEVEVEAGAPLAACSDGDGVWVSDGTPAMASGGRRPSPGLPCHGGSSCGPGGGPEGLSQEAEEAGAGSCPVPPEKRAGQDTPPGGERGPSFGGERGRPPADYGQGRAAPRQASPVQVLHATSSVGAVTRQSGGHSLATHTFCSIAEVHVAEGFVQDRGAADGPGLRGKIYDYYAQSVSRAEVQESPPCAPPVPSVPSSGPEAPPGPATEEGQAAAAEGPGPSPETPLHLTQGESSPAQAEAPSRDPAGGNQPQQPPGARGGLSRKESFREIAENPELQVPMDGFGSPAPEEPGRAPRLPQASPASALAASVRSSAAEQPTVERVAGAEFFRIPLSPAASLDMHVDLGNCCELLCLAKERGLERLREAAYRVMSDNYLQVLRTPAIYGRLNAAERDLILQRRMRGRPCVAVAEVSARARGPHASRLCVYDDQSDAWRLLTHLPLEAASTGSAACAMFNYLFVAAGCTGHGASQRPSRRVFCYNPCTRVWRELCPLNQARPHCKLLALDGCLYAIGGECLHTVERYDPRLDRWAFAAPLPSDAFAVAHTATACAGEIYATGGTLRYKLLRYSGQGGAWKVSLTGGSRDRTAEMVTAGGFIYRFDLNRSRGIAVYRCSARAKLWYECATHPAPVPAAFRCAVVGNLVHCIGPQLHLRFLADPVSPRFGSKELQRFPSPRGALLPLALVLPDTCHGGAVQTRV
ncbi:kelch domain-containing protein 7A [Varanus komodoensis]|uniref:kelch domain-containing protein 7A n=1 Tax=Varanus komodoensis TaxID=61221 RepID=UPI001CF7AD2F|nr:kelch domain-containing protein 7A [Varanus komodoensis]